MEGLAALSLIANTFQVVDLSCQILKAAWEAYKTGALSSNASREQVALDLRTANDFLQAKLKTHARQSVSKDDQATLDLASKATAVADELLQHLKKVNSSTKSQPFKSICNAIKASWTREKISGMVQDLESLRDEAEYRIVISLRAAADDHGSQLAGLDTRTSAILNAVIDSKSSYRDELQRQAQALSQRLTVSEHAADKRHAEILTAVQSLSIILPSAKQATPTTLAFTENRHCGAPAATAILEWLCFARMEARRDAIKERHRKTFEWAFDDTRTVRGSPLGFAQWALESSGIYWIKGKAGSGKSTLMKMISEDERTHQMLSEWAGDDELLFSSFYFWNQGSEMQRSTLGLLRSLLYDVLKDRPEMTAIAFPGWLSKFMTLDPTLGQMTSALLRVINSRDARRKVAFMVDGLDEFEGDSSDTTMMAKFLCEMAHAPHVKLLVSSRPLQPFEEVFRECPKLAVQDLTADDIRLVARETLELHSRMADLMEECPQRAALVIDHISEKSSGVFLWVRVAINAVLDGLQSYDGIDELEERLNELSPDLNELFSLIIRRIPPRYREVAYRLLQITHCWQKVTDIPLYAVTCLFALKAGQEVSFKMPIAPLEAPQFRKYLHELAVLLRTRCLGLLEVEETFESPNPLGLSSIDDSSQDDSSRYESSLEPPSRVSDDPQLSGASVGFLHRSIVEFLETSESLETTFEERYPLFDAHVAIMEGLVVQLKTWNGYWASGPHLDVMGHLMEFNKLAEAFTGRPQTRILHTFDATMSVLYRTQYPDRKRDPLNQYGNCLQLTDHWSNYTYDPIELDEIPLSAFDKSTFLSFTIEWGAVLYSKEQLELHGGHLPPKQGRPLLDYAVSPEYSLAMYPRIAKMLLERGASPNETYDGYSPWQSALRKLPNLGVECATTGAFSMPYVHGYYSRIFETVELLLSFGADPHAFFDRKDRNTDGVWEDERCSAPMALRASLKSLCPCSLQQLGGARLSIANCSCPTASELKSKIENLLKQVEGVNHPATAHDRNSPRSDRSAQPWYRPLDINEWFSMALQWMFPGNLRLE